ncbi:hypothetical protein Bbelb_312830 [Branchiostoma belcheri]|nr:hypothetical protein Bbelb_312830 [Branchiostoma belcheri]
MRTIAMPMAASDDVTGEGCEGQYPVKPLEAYVQHLTTHQGWVTRKRDGANIVSPSIEMVDQGKTAQRARASLGVATATPLVTVPRERYRQSPTRLLGRADGMTSRDDTVNGSRRPCALAQAPSANT